jgi:hypothetical protein
MARMKELWAAQQGQTNVVYNIRQLTKDLNELEPGLKNRMVREAKEPAKPLISAIRRVIPSTAPLSGMSKANNSGRLAWGAGRKADNVVAKFRAGRSRRTAITPLVSIWVQSPMTAIADVAGKGNMRKAKPVTNEYAYKDGTRRHRVTSQGQTMVNKLRERNQSNFVYPAVEDALPNAEREIKLVIDKYARMVNRKLN